MNSKLIQTLTGAALLLSVNAAQAVSCNLSSPGFIDGYDNAIQNVNQTSYSISCTRDANDPNPATTSYAVSVSNGIFANGSNNQASDGGANRIKYELFTGSTCSQGTLWKSNTTVPNPAGSITISGTSPTTVTQSFWGCINAGQNPAAGIYTDSVLMTPTYSAGVINGTPDARVLVKIITPATCTISAITGITLAYGNAFGPGATATTNAPATCSNQLPYTIAVSPTSGVSAGIFYTLSLPASQTGTGAVQNIPITATAPPGQAGTCTTGSCTGAAQPHTLTLTY